MHQPSTCSCPIPSRGENLFKRVIIGLAIAGTIIALIMIALQAFGLSRRTITIDPTLISPLGGFGYVYPISGAPPIAGMNLRSDKAGSHASDLVLKENGTALTDPHSQHSEIVSEGNGRYSHWGATLYFSTSDRTDPRSNGRTYQAEYSFAPPAWLILAVLALDAVAVRLWLPSISIRPIDKLILSRADTLPLTLLGAVASFEVLLLLAANSSPTIIQNTDAGTISGWVAGELHPDRLASDFVVSDPSTSRFYISAFVPVVKSLASYTDDIGLAYLFMYIPIVLIELFGYYLLGLRITGNRLWSSVLALMTIVPVWNLGRSDLFGLYWIPLVRNAYDGLLPFLIIAFLSFGARLAALPVLFALCGLTIYVHPVSAPVGAAGLWLGSFALAGPRTSFGRNFAVLIAAGLVFVLMATPFAISFFSSFSGGEVVNSPNVTELQADALKDFQKSLAPGQYDAWLAVREFLGDTGVTAWPIWVTGLAGLIFVPFVQSKFRRTCHFFLLFLLGCLGASVGLSWVDQAIAHWLGRTPFQLDLIRGMRLIVMPVLVGFVLLLTLVETRFFAAGRLAPLRPAIPAAAILLVAYWWGLFPNWISDRIGISSITNDVKSQDPDASALISYLRGRPSNGTVLPIGRQVVGQAVRYAGLQPLAFLKIDANSLFYSGSDKWIKWAELNKLNRAMLDPNNRNGADSFDLLAARSGARYVVLEKGAVSPTVETHILAKGKMINQFGHWSLVELN
ncbi:hypothetical protein SAZ10_04165 [Mesorhizobium sp. BAC0120]|uniref:hypothetical protein n=1 Tax=Mesorhizobium sp. BAC0120 TaxID=3090670 RepID=UPI00298C8234|nr:hypothetical protein [Mesorhizobium sp. BAC0120]MDW6020952.1 hypothetical protein [Mesorhizobium sp. BAC0120]